jgi:pyrroloquinoline quinone (PQQ) biosynthesis protein C
MKEFKEKFDRLVAETMETPEMLRFFSVPLNWARAQILAKQMALFVKNRRTCWGYAAAGSPHLDVKCVIAEHEHEELVYDPRCGSGHFELYIKQGEKLGLKPEEIIDAQPLPATRTAFYAWIYMAKDWPWLLSYATCVAVEKMNDNRVIPGGGMSLRQGKRMIEDLGLSWKDLKSEDVHRTADEDHSDMTWGVFECHARDPRSQEEVLQAAIAALDVYRSFFNAVAEACERIGAISKELEHQHAEKEHTL